MTTTRKTAAQKAADAAEREEYTGHPETAEGKEPETAEGEEGRRPGETLQQLKNRLRNEAERDVLNAHRDEVIKITEGKYKAHGLEYVRRLTDQERAQRDIEDHLEKYPELEAYLAARVSRLARLAQDGEAEGGHSAVREVEHREGE